MMTDRELMQQALEALNRVMRHGSAVQEAKDILRAALRERLAQPQRTHWEGCEEVHPECRKQRREWVGLTDEEIEAVDKTIDKFVPLSDGKRLYARALEAKLKEKNGLYAALVAAAEREACAKVCEDMGRGHGSAFAEFDCVAAIRARGEK